MPGDPLDLWRGRQEDRRGSALGRGLHERSHERDQHLEDHARIFRAKARIDDAWVEHVRRHAGAFEAASQLVVQAGEIIKYDVSIE